MATLAQQVQGERMARIVLSMIAEPDDLTTGYVLVRHGGVATLSLVESDHDVTGLVRADILLWRERLRARIAPDLMERVAEAEQHGFGTPIPADRGWPAGLDELLDRIGDTGLLMSELPPGVAPTRDRFIARNRLMAALSGGVVVPEAGVRSGSLSAVLTAHRLGRGVGAVPGPVTSAVSYGPNECHRPARCRRRAQEGCDSVRDWTRRYRSAQYSSCPRPLDLDTEITPVRRALRVRCTSS